MLFNLYIGAVVASWWNNCTETGVDGIFRQRRKLVEDRTAKSRLGVVKITEIEVKVTETEVKVTEIEVKVTEIEVKVTEIEVKVTEIEVKVTETEVRLQMMWL